jgi:hypothetical protein
MFNVQIVYISQVVWTAGLGKISSYQKNYLRSKQHKQYFMKS